MLYEGPYCTGKTGKMAQNIHMIFGNLAKTQGMLFAQVVKSPMLKLQDIEMCSEIFNIF